MASKNIVKCQFCRCSYLHDSTDVNKSEAVKEGKKYYHPDCFALKSIVAKTCEFFKENINDKLTLKQTIELTSVVYGMIFDKGYDPDYVYYCVWYMNKYRPGKLRFPSGLYYVAQDREIERAWNKFHVNSEKEAKQEEKKQIQTELFEDDEETFRFVQDKPVGFADILG